MQLYRSVTSLVLKTSSLEDAYKALVLAAKTSHSQGRRVKLER